MFGLMYVPKKAENTVVIPLASYYSLASPFLAFDLFVLGRFHQIGYANPSQK
jgi:hypothetical protein